MTTPRRTVLPLPASSPTSTHLLLLLADTPNPAVKAAHGDYHDIFSAMFKLAISSADPAPPADGRTLTVESYDVVQGSYPSVATLASSTGLLITGSAASAHEPLPWIATLTAFTASLPALYPDLRLVGICFGHQVVARAFGGKCVKNPAGWEVGVRDLQLSEAGSKVFGGKSLTIHQMHQDHVPDLPPTFELIGSTPICPVHGMVRRDPVSGAVRVLTLQGHPEFTPDIVQKVIDAREKNGVFSPEMVEQSRKHAVERDEGIRIARVILEVLGMS